MQAGGDGETAQAPRSARGAYGGVPRETFIRTELSREEQPGEVVPCLNRLPIGKEIGIRSQAIGGA